MIIQNKIRTPDGTILESIHRHDYVEHKDKNGNIYAIDGGKSYLRRLFSSKADYEELSVESTDSHDKIREAFIWTTAKDEKLVLKNMETSHIENILKTQLHISDTVHRILEDELNLRNKQ